jgi:hypothetical protein
MCKQSYSEYLAMYGVGKATPARMAAGSCLASSQHRANNCTQECLDSEKVAHQCRTFSTNARKATELTLALQSRERFVFIYYPTYAT